MRVGRGRGVEEKREGGKRGSRSCLSAASWRQGGGGGRSKAWNQETLALISCWNEQLNIFLFTKGDKCTEVGNIQYIRNPLH
uniref:Uncharacterized protein n=1 Tax=Arundo donax TaxID=35708 RepID=A0A0A9EAX8_ARUDO